MIAAFRGKVSAVDNDEMYSGKPERAKLDNCPCRWCQPEPVETPKSGWIKECEDQLSHSKEEFGRAAYEKGPDDRTPAEKCAAGEHEAPLRGGYILKWHEETHNLLVLVCEFCRCVYVPR